MKCEYFCTEDINIVQRDLELISSFSPSMSPQTLTFLHVLHFARHSVKLVFPLGFENNN